MYDKIYNHLLNCQNDPASYTEGFAIRHDGISRQDAYHFGAVFDDSFVKLTDSTGKPKIGLFSIKAINDREGLFYTGDNVTIEKIEIIFTYLDEKGEIREQRYTNLENFIELVKLN